LSHLRQQIRERAATRLTGLSTTGSNVFQSRTYPLERASLPGICIFTNEETSEIQSQGNPRNVQKILSLSIQGFATQGFTGVDDTLDTISKEIEIAMQGDINLNNLAQDSYLSETSISISGEGEKEIGSVTLTYTVIYQHAENNPGAAL
tara:strand:- start:60 stop:506 length:447 start_codon:yes stop_codon:yes gene_type:complete